MFVRRIKETLQLRPEQVWTVRRAETRDTTAPVSCSLSSSFCCNRTSTHKPPHIHRTSTHKPRTRNFSWAPDGLQSDIDTDRVMVNIDTGILIANPNLNDFQMKMNSVFKTISEWFMSQDGVVSVATRYGLEGPGTEFR